MRGKYSFLVKMLSLLLAGLAATSYLIPVEDKVEDWIPLLSGFVNLDGLWENTLLLGILGAVFNILIVVSLLAINTKSVNNVFNPVLSAQFFLLIILLNPQSVYFSSIHPAVLLFVWGQYCFVINQKFTSMFLLSCAALFYAPLLIALPVILAISIPGAADIPRVALKSLGGIVLPFVYLLIFRYMAFGDAGVFVHEYIEHATVFSSPFYGASFTSIFLVICLAAITVHSVSYMLAQLYSSSIVTVHILKMELLSIAVGVLLFFLFWGNSHVPVNMLVALPMAMLFSHYFTANIKAATARVEIILLCCAAVLCRLAYFI